VVVTPGVEHAICCRHSPVHVELPPPPLPPPQRFATPPPPQMSGELHEPQLIEPPQPSPIQPQFAFALAHVVGVQTTPASFAYALPQTLGTPPPPQMYGAVQVPQSSRPPQPSPTGPQFAPALAHVFGVQTTPASFAYGFPHTLGTPAPPQMYGALQVPQSSEPPQPSPMRPQLAPAVAHVFGVQTTPASFA
jgi:hypothetical protein